MVGGPSRLGPLVGASEATTGLGHTRWATLRMAVGLSDPIVSRVVLIGCGTSLRAGMAARFMFERWARVVTSTEVASEWRYRDPIVGPDTLLSVQALRKQRRRRVPLG